MVDLDLLDIEYSGPEVDAQIAAIKERVERTGWPCFFDPRRRIQKQMHGHGYPTPTFPETFRCGVCGEEKKSDGCMSSATLVVEGKSAYCCQECLRALGERWGGVFKSND